MGLKNLKLFFLSCSLLSSNLLAGNSALSELKKSDLQIDREINDKKATTLKYSWINPIVASYTYSINDQLNAKNHSKYFRISLDQPIFKSGGIYFAIKYSQASKNFVDIATNLKEQNLIKSLYETLLNLKKIDIQIKKSKLQIENASFDVTRKKEQFEAGLLDSSFLDSAILNKSKLDQLLLDLDQKRFTLISTFKNLSDEDYKSVSLPRFEMVKESEFIEKNIQLHSLNAKKSEARYLKNMTISNFLPTLSLFGEYANKKDSFRLFKQNNEYKNYGFRVSMPILDVNMMRKIEVEKLNYIKSKLALQDKKRELKNSFSSFKNRISILEKREVLAKKDTKLYNRLLAVANDGFKAGEKTMLDVNTLKNSKVISNLDVEIFEKDIQLTFLDLYAKMSDAI